MKIDIGAGTTKQDGWIGIDKIAFPGIDHVMDAGKDRWPFDDNSVDEARANHFVEHLTAPERIHFVNELWRCLKVGAKCQIVTPHWASTRAYGDLTHQWPPVSEFWFYYLNREWRKANAPHNTDYTCNFEAAWGYGVHPQLTVRNAEYQSFALSFYKEAAQDLMATVTKAA